MEGFKKLRQTVAAALAFGGATAAETAQAQQVEQPQAIENINFNDPNTPLEGPLTGSPRFSDTSYTPINPREPETSTPDIIERFSGEDPLTISAENIPFVRRMPGAGNTSIGGFESPAAEEEIVGIQFRAER